MGNSNERNLYLRAAGLGMMAGMRSMSAPLLMSYRANKYPEGFKGTWLGWLGYRQVLGLFSLMEVGELIADKTALLPSRIKTVPLYGRAQLGACAGVAAFTEADKPAWIGAIVSALGAIASSFVFYHLRRGVGQRTGLPDPIVALAEDATLAGIALGVLKTYE